MLEEGNDLNMETPPPEEGSGGPESSNRTFLIVGGIMAGIVLLTLVCFAGYFVFLGPRLAAQRSGTQTAVGALNAQVAAQMTATAQATLFTQTPLPSPLPTDTETPLPATPTSSPVVAQPSATSPLADAALTATMASLQTQVAANLTITVTPEATAIPQTGFADQVGLPGLIGLTVVLVVVILLARRLRRTPAG